MGTGIRSGGNLTARRTPLGSGTTRRSKRGCTILTLLRRESR